MGTYLRSFGGGLLSEPLDSDAVDNSSTVAGATVTAALDTLKTAAGTAATGTREITGTSGSLVAGDELRSFVCVSNGSAVSITVASAANGGPPAGSRCRISQCGAGQITISAGTGATIRNVFGLTKTRGQWACVEVWTAPNGTDIVLTGDLTS